MKVETSDTHDHAVTKVATIANQATPSRKTAATKPKANAEIASDTAVVSTESVAEPVAVTDADTGHSWSAGVRLAETGVKKMFFAGLGVYGRAYDELISRAEVMNHQGRAWFDSLVERGEKLEQDTSQVLSHYGDKVEQRYDQLLSRTLYFRPLCRLSDISEKLDRLNETLEADKVKAA